MYPSKSAVIGLLAASLGYRRNQDEDISPLNSLQFAVRVDQPGKLMRDYHTAMKYTVKKGELQPFNYVTDRYYLEDAVFTVGIGSEDGSLIEKLAQAVLNPYFQTFLGRRSIPLTYDFYLGVFETDVIDCLKRLPWQAGKRYKKQYYRENGKTVRLNVYADAGLLPEGVRQLRKDDVVSFGQKGRRFEYRTEARRRFDFENPCNGAEHDAFGALGD